MSMINSLYFLFVWIIVIIGLVIIILSFWRTMKAVELIARSMVALVEYLKKLEVNSLSTDINHRKMQLIDLRFEKYNLMMDFKTIDILNNKAEVKVVERSEIYQNASPNICSKLRDEHTIKMEKVDGEWLIVSDTSNDSTKKDMLMRIKMGKKASKAKAEILENSKNEVMLK